MADGCLCHTLLFVATSTRYHDDVSIAASNYCYYITTSTLPLHGMLPVVDYCITPMAKSTIDVDLTLDSSDDGTGYEPSSVALVVELDTAKSRYHSDRQFWRWCDSNCAVATYATVMEFALSHLNMLGNVPHASYLGSVFNSRSSLGTVLHPEPLKLLHDHAIRSSPHQATVKLSMSRILETYPGHVGSASGELEFIMESHVTMPVVTGEYGRPVQKRHPSKVIVGEDGDAGTSIASYLDRCRLPLPAVLQVDVCQNGILPCVLPPMTLRVFDAQSGGFTDRCVQYRFCALVACNKSHYKAVLQCPEGVMWSYDSMKCNNNSEGQLVPRQRRNRVWPDMELILNKYKVDVCMYVLSSSSITPISVDAPLLCSANAAYAENMRLLSRITGVNGYIFRSGKDCITNVTQHAFTLAANVLLYIGTDGHRVHRKTHRDVNRPKMLYWHYEGNDVGKGGVATQTPAYYDAASRDSYEAILRHVETGPLGQAVSDGSLVLRTSGFLLENINYKVTRESQDTTATGAVTKREQFLEGLDRSIGASERLERSSSHHPTYAWPPLGMVSRAYPVPGYTHVDTTKDERGASLNVVVILTEHGCMYHAIPLLHKSIVRL